MIDFEDTRTAFSIKSDRDLRRAYVLFKLISYPILVKIGNPVIQLCSALRIPIGWIVKPTAFKHFVGGATLEACQPAVEKLKTVNVYSILDYSVEGKETDKAIEAALKETLRAVKHAGNNPDIPFAVFKPTAFGNSRALEILSGASVPDKDVIREGEKFRSRIDLLCKTAFDNDTSIMIDAEDTFYQRFIDSVVMDMMRKYNYKKAIVFNTYQMYRHDRIGVLEADIASARKGHFYLGAKFVRGAYMERERERARKLRYMDPIQPDRESTDRDYNLALKISMDNIDVVSIFNGTHNEYSSMYLTELMNERKIKPSDNRIWFSQLFGMSEHISFNVAAAGFNVAKYVPYGPVRYVLPYLMRRVEENSSVKGQTGRELSLIKKEMIRRKKHEPSMPK
ncbi:MAG: proline dehydrogenase family protein [Bacteroidales bacterium]|nr:proline dehydrogenase family protein [Bacteroidales bacterium]